MMIQDVFIQRLKKAMSACDVNARELAKRSGLSEGAISRYLSGKMEPRIPAIGKMAEALHVDPVWLLGYDDAPDLTVEVDGTKLLIEQLTPSERSDVERYIKFLISQRGDQK